MPNQLVKAGYNKAAEDYALNRDRFKTIPYLEELHNHLNAHSTILDIGCGAGVPVDRFLVERGHRIIGIDISEKMIELAKNNVPKAEYEVKDMSDLKEDEYNVDAVVSFYAIFHTPREKHQELFRKINSFLPTGGLILITMGSGEWEGEEENFHGAKMWWSHYGRDKNIQIIKDAGFEILLNKIDTSGNEKHLVILARKIRIITC